MASNPRPNPSWTEPQRALQKTVMEALDIAIPYSAPEIPLLDNHTSEQICDELGVVKAAVKAFEKVEGILKERLKPRIGSEGELRGARFVASMRDSERYALSQARVKQFLSRADVMEVDLERLLDAIEEKEVSLPNKVFLEEEETNLDSFSDTTPVPTLNVKAI